MVEGNKIEDWIGAAEIDNKFGRDHFFGVFIQAHLGGINPYYVVIFDKRTEHGLVGGLAATREQLDRLKELGVEVKG